MDVGIGDIIQDGGFSIIFSQPNSLLFTMCIEFFADPAVIVLCLVGGLKIGWSFLKRAFR